MILWSFQRIFKPHAAPNQRIFTVKAKGPFVLKGLGENTVIYMGITYHETDV